MKHIAVNDNKVGDVLYCIEGDSDGSLVLFFIQIVTNFFAVKEMVISLQAQ